MAPEFTDLIQEMEDARRDFVPDIDKLLMSPVILLLGAVSYSLSMWLVLDILHSSLTPAAYLAYSPLGFPAVLVSMLSLTYFYLAPLVAPTGRVSHLYRRILGTQLTRAALISRGIAVGAGVGLCSQALALLASKVF
jgi:hypothetical protein